MERHNVWSRRSADYFYGSQSKLENTSNTIEKTGPIPSFKPQAGAPSSIQVSEITVDLAITIFTLFYYPINFTFYVLDC